MFLYRAISSPFKTLHTSPLVDPFIHGKNSAGITARRRPSHIFTTVLRLLTELGQSWKNENARASKRSQRRFEPLIESPAFSIFLNKTYGNASMNVRTRSFVFHRKENVLRLWMYLLELLKARRMRLELSLHLQKVFQEMLYVLDWIDEIKVTSPQTCHNFVGKIRICSVKSVFFSENLIFPLKIRISPLKTLFFQWNSLFFSVKFPIFFSEIPYFASENLYFFRWKSVSICIIPTYPNTA